jgi:diguanylate cyclase (GGDEF)-like protein/PAS domain S-box-containing protein
MSRLMRGIAHHVAHGSADVRGNGTRMIDRNELMEAALESFPEGLALLGYGGEVAFWNRAAEAITGFPVMEIRSRIIPWALEPLLRGDNADRAEEPRRHAKPARYALIHVQHRSGHELCLMTRAVILRDALGARIGSAVIFHPADHVEPLLHGESSEECDVRSAQEEMEELAQSAFEEFVEKGAPLGMLWIAVDQAQELRKTHGATAWETMIERIERTLSHGLRPGDELGRWGDDEFLVLSHEPTAAALAAHAQRLAGLARTSDFRWWGDRLSLTVSIGAAQAASGEALPQLLERAQAAMFASTHAGGNHITLAPERQSCLPS